MKKKFLIFVSVFALLLSLSSITAFAEEDPSSSPDPTPISLPVENYVPNTVFSGGLYFHQDTSFLHPTFLKFYHSNNSYLMSVGLNSVIYNSIMERSDFLDSVIWCVYTDGVPCYFSVVDTGHSSGSVSWTFVISPVPDLNFFTVDFSSDTNVVLFTYIPSSTGVVSVSGDFLSGIMLNIGSVLNVIFDNWVLALFVLIVPLSGIVIGLVFRVRKRR